MVLKVFSKSEILLFSIPFKKIFDTLKNHNYLKEDTNINKIDILFKKIEIKND